MLVGLQKFFEMFVLCVRLYITFTVRQTTAYTVIMLWSNLIDVTSYNLQYLSGT